MTNHIKATPRTRKLAIQALKNRNRELKRMPGNEAGMKWRDKEIERNHSLIKQIEGM